MESGDNQAAKKIDSFFRTSFKYYGKEIGLTSRQYFGIDQIINQNKDQDDEYNYIMQYGFPQSGCVSMHFTYSQKSNSFIVDSISVYAPPAGENFVMANFAPQTQVGEIGISMNFGIKTGTKKHTSLDEINANPNALKMLDVAISDLSQAQILGECRLEVPEGSERIPCCDCTYISNSKGKSI